jgi:hypothetical protein
MTPEERVADAIALAERMRARLAMPDALIYVVFFVTIAVCIFLPETVLFLPRHLIPVASRTRALLGISARNNGPSPPARLWSGAAGLVKI